MNCDKVKALFLGYHDGDLSAEETAAIEAHLKDCNTCNADWEAYLITLSEVSGMFSLKAPEDFTQKVKQTIGKRSKGRFFSEDRRLGTSFAIVSLLLILACMLLYLYLSTEREIEVMPSSDKEIQNIDNDDPL